MKKDLLRILTIGVAACAISFGQGGTGQGGAQGGGPGNSTGGQQKTGTSGKGVTTNDGVADPTDSNNTGSKSKRGKKDQKMPKTAPQTPVVDPHEDPSSPINQPKANPTK
jgi:hypothetical protein